MAKELRTQYNEYLNNTAPDMDMLWSRIESRIDLADNTNDTNKTVEISNITVNQNNETENTHEENRQKIKVSSFNFKRFAAVAAAFIVVIAGISVLKNGGMQMEKSTDNAAPETRAAATEEAPVAGGDAAPEMMNEAEAGDAYTDEDFDADDEDGVTMDNGGNFFKNDTDAKTKGAEKAEDATDGATYSDNGGAAINAKDQTIKIDDDTEIDYETYISLTDSDIEFTDLKLADTDTIGYQTSYIPSDSDPINQRTILADTQYFADVSVAKAELGEKQAEYTLTVNEWYTLDESEEVTVGELTVRSSTPYILQEGREYLVALKKSDDEWQLEFDSAPQIQKTLDGGYVFPVFWLSLYYNNGAHRFLYPDYELGNAEHQLMLYSDKADINGLLEQWRSEN